LAKKLGLTTPETRIIDYLYGGEWDTIKTIYRHIIGCWRYIDRVNVIFVLILMNVDLAARAVLKKDDCINQDNAPAICGNCSSG